MRLIGKIKLICQFSSHLLFQREKILGMDSPLKAFFVLKGSFAFSIGFRGSSGQLGRGLKFNEKYLSCKQGSKPRETFGNKAVPCNDLAALENLYSRKEALELPVKIAKFATALSALSRLSECIQGG